MAQSKLLSSEIFIITLLPDVFTLGPSSESTFVVHTFHLIIDHFIQPLIDGIIHVVPFRDLPLLSSPLLAITTTIV